MITARHRAAPCEWRARRRQPGLSPTAIRPADIFSPFLPCVPAHFHEHHLHHELELVVTSATVDHTPSGLLFDRLSRSTPAARGSKGRVQPGLFSRVVAVREVLGQWTRKSRFGAFAVRLARVAVALVHPHRFHLLLQILADFHPADLRELFAVFARRRDWFREHQVSLRDVFLGLRNRVEKSLGADCLGRSALD